MLTGLDGVVIEVADLAEGVRAFEALLGFAPQPVARRADSTDAFDLDPDLDPAFAFDLGNAKLELRASPSPSPSREGIAGLRFAFHPEPDSRFTAGHVEGPSVPVELVARDEPDLREAQGEPRERNERGSSRAGGAGVSTGIRGVDHVVVGTRDVERARRFFGEDLGLRLALDRAFPERGIRLLFFRVGGVTIEVASMLAEPSALAAGSASAADRALAEPDGFRGLALKVEGIDAVHARLEASGLEVSPVRAGFKPGTRVFGARTPVHGVALLWIEHPPRPGW